MTGSLGDSQLDRIGGIVGENHNTLLSRLTSQDNSLVQQLSLALLSL